MSNHKSDKPDRKFRRLFRFDGDASSVEREVDDELQFHFELAVRELMAKGASEADARAEAERRFGDIEGTRRGLNEIDRAHRLQSRRAEWIGNLLQDARYAVRGLRRKPGFAVAVVLILALGIGANATMFGIVDRLLLRAPAFLAHADRVHRVYLSTTQNGKELFVESTNYRRFHELTDSARTIDVAAAWWSPRLAVGLDNPRELRVVYATAGYWKLFSMQPAIGRFFSPSEDVPNHAAKVIVLGYAYWQTAYGGRGDVIGGTLRVNRLDYTIIGVAPQGFNGIGNQAVVAYVPLASGAENSFPGNGRQHWYATYGLNWMQIVVRRKPEVSVAAATAEFDSRFAGSYATQRTENPGTAAAAIAKPHTVIAPVLAERGPNQGTDVKVAVWLVGVALIVLIIACANVSNLLLARALQRRREIALRLALGISRRRLVAQFVVESVVLALLGGLAGLAVTEWGGRILRATLLPNVSWSSTLSDGRTILFSAAVALLAGVLTGLIPALREGRASLSNALKSGNREGTYQRSRLQSSLLVLQGALSVVLLVGAGLFVRSLQNVQSTQLGYDAGRIAWVEAHLRGVVLDSTQRNALYDEMFRAAEAVPATERVAFGAMIPFYSDWEESLFVTGVDSVNNLGTFLLQVVSPGYFETMGTKIVRGRSLSADDRAGAPGAVVISQSMARALWPKRDALSQCLRIGADTVPCSYVVGIAEDIKYTSLLDDTGLQYYVPREQRRNTESILYLRFRNGAAANVENVRTAVQRVMPGGSYVTVQPLTDVLDVVRRSWQLGATMFALFGFLALIVASVGLYSVISYTVAGRTQEMGVRVALGARTVDVIRLVLSQSVSVSLLAIALGLGVALAAAGWVKPLLFQTSPRDPLVYFGVASVLLTVAILAALFPALRAARVDPSVALRSD